MAEGITRMDPWPACSPDMNPIEHCWDQLGRAVRKRIQPGDTLADIRRYLTEEWPNIPQARIQRLIHSMRGAELAVIATVASLNTDL